MQSFLIHKRRNQKLKVIALIIKRLQPKFQRVIRSTELIQTKEETNMKKGLTEMLFILDRSGSMHGLEKETIGGFNSLIEKQKKWKAPPLSAPFYLMTEWK